MVTHLEITSRARLYVADQQHIFDEDMFVFVSGVSLQLLNTVDSLIIRAISLSKIISPSLQCPLTLNIYSTLNYHAVKYVLVG